MAKQQKNELMEWLKAILVAIVVASLIRIFLFAPIVVEGDSMEPTLHTKDRMIVNKIGKRLGTIDRFDIIVFHASQNRDYIKRVIGLPGDKIVYKDDILYVNGEPIEEPYLEANKEELIGSPLTESFTLQEITGEKTVPQGQLFVMGDNRRYSKDSRHIGFIQKDQVVGETALVYWPLSKIRLIK
ncbi:signal peptidase I [Metabacillus arenae]|uniref:Signal peptidase I n=1 Tax=Metabacillus arenae TaxID=2771434 RepID=A0A926RWL2_9BACI|nr:signal peptidase I [Metabacillus arenae]MBD1380026.1 signal peptidase I [Metabacillus arenae]